MGHTLLDTPDQLRRFLFAIIESLPGGMLLADKNGDLLAVNRKASLLLGISGSSVQNRSCWELLRRVLGLGVQEVEALNRPGGRILCEVGGPNPEQDDRFLLISRNDLQSPFLDVSGFFLSLEDITFPALIEAQQDRQKRLAAMQEMAAAMSQELKNPLGSLELYASILKRELSEEPDNERIAGQMLGAIRTMNHQLNNFVAFAGLPQPEMCELDLGRVLEKSLDTLAEVAGERGIVIDNCFPAKGVGLQGDPVLLEQLLVNLGMNGIESMAAGGRIIFTAVLRRSTNTHPAFWEIGVEDQGGGIAPHDMGKVFDPFFTTKDRRKGLGLALCHSIAEAHRGLIKVESILGQGTRFKVMLPVSTTTTPIQQ